MQLRLSALLPCLGLHQGGEGRCAVVHHRLSTIAVCREARVRVWWVVGVCACGVCVVCVCALVSMGLPWQPIPQC